MHGDLQTKGVNIYIFFFPIYNVRFIVWVRVYGKGKVWVGLRGSGSGTFSTFTIISVRPFSSAFS